MLGWMQGPKDVDQLIARGRLQRAIQLLRKELGTDPGNERVALRLSDVLARTGREGEAVEVLMPVVDSFARAGFVAKAVAVIKKIERLDPDQAQRAEQLVSRLQDDTTTKPLPLVHPSQAHKRAKKPRARPTRVRTPPKTSELVVPEAWFEESKGRQDFSFSPLFDDFSRSELAAVIGGLKLLVKNPGAIVYTQGESGGSLFILATGEARVYVRDASGKNRQIGMVEEGAFFGAASLLGGAPRAATIVAASVCELLEFDRETFARISERHPQVRERVAGFVTERSDRGMITA